MDVLVKWLGVGVLVFALAQAGKTVEPEIAAGLPGPVGSEDLSVWVLETHNEIAVPFSSSRTKSPRSVANRNSNPLNIKLGSKTRRYVDIGLATISDVIPKDGGRFLKFDCPETGFRAAVELLSTPPYDDLRLDGALRRWSNNGFGAEILAGTQLDALRPVHYLGRDHLKILLNAMAVAEGYKSSTITDEVKNALRP